MIFLCKITQNLQFKKQSNKCNFFFLRELPAGDDFEKMRGTNYEKSDIFFIMFSTVDPTTFNNAINKVLNNENKKK